MAERQAPHNPDRLPVVAAFIPTGAYRHREQRARQGIARWRCRSCYLYTCARAGRSCSVLPRRDWRNEVPLPSERRL